LIEAIGLTPFSREELALASQRQTEGISELERARRFFVCARQVRTGLAETSSAGRWAHCLLTSRAGISGAVSQWLGSIDDLSLIAQRLLRVQIENAPAIEVIKRYDSAETLFYCDPPYPHGSRNDSKAYAHEMTDTEHRELAVVLRNVQGKVASSSYHCDLMDELYSDWNIVEADSKMCHSYDEGYIGQFIAEHCLPCNTTTAFLTPALRNRSEPLTPNTNLVGRPPELYKAALQLLDDVYTGTVSADDLLAESIRVLLIVKHENQHQKFLKRLTIMLKASTRKQVKLKYHC
jgi:D12 class N6 adenine-specific DNA methyltransferase